MRLPTARISIGDRMPLSWLAGEDGKFWGVFWGIMIGQAFVGFWYRTERSQP